MTPNEPVAESAIGHTKTVQADQAVERAATKPRFLACALKQNRNRVKKDCLPLDTPSPSGIKTIQSDGIARF